MKSNEPLTTRRAAVARAVAGHGFLSVREIASVLTGMRKMGVADRGLVIRLLRGAMERYPEYFGLWCVFEPEAFDARDAHFIGRAGHDAAGRFAPRWERVGGRLRFGQSCGHDSPALGGWYHLTRDSRQEVVFGPYDENLLTGRPILCLSRVAPILDRERFIGAVGVDVSLDALREGRSDTDRPQETMLERWHVFVTGEAGIEFASPAARRLLNCYIGPCRRGQLPAALRLRLENAGASPATVTFENAHGQLRVHDARHPHTGQRILSLEVQPARQRTPSGALISAREQEILEWVEQSKSNGEIALIVGLSEHTVRHHLERIFAKLGVENRRAAALSARVAGAGSGERLLSCVPPADGTVRPWRARREAAIPAAQRARGGQSHDNRDCFNA